MKRMIPRLWIFLKWFKITILVLPIQCEIMILKTEKIEKRLPNCQHVKKFPYHFKKKIETLTL